MLRIPPHFEPVPVPAAVCVSIRDSLGFDVGVETLHVNRGRSIVLAPFIVMPAELPNGSCSARQKVSMGRQQVVPPRSDRVLLGPVRISYGLYSVWCGQSFTAPTTSLPVQTPS